MNQQIATLQQEALEQLSKAAELSELENLRVAYLGKKGSITALLKGMKDLSHEERKTFGAEVNELKELVTQEIEKKTAELKEAEIKKEIANKNKNGAMVNYLHNLFGERWDESVIYA